MALKFALERAKPPVDISLVFPAYLARSDDEAMPEQARVLFEVLDTSPDVPAFQPKPDLPAPVKEALAEPTQAVQDGLMLLALTEGWQGDWLLTERPVLLNARHHLYQHHRIRIIPPGELGDWVEVVAHGSGMFWSASKEGRQLTEDVFYPLAHWKNRLLANWFSSVGPLVDRDLAEHLRSALLNRYPFILLSRDLVRYYELQMDYLARRGQDRRFAIPLGYYVTNFYLHLWGLLDHLAVIANRALNLGMDDRDCGIMRPTFLRNLGARRPALASFLARDDISEWIKLIADVRHPAAHHSMLLPRQTVVETEESRKSDEEIREILRREEPWWYESMTPEAIAALEAQRIWLWRLERMKVIAENVVFVNRGEKSYMRGPVVSIDADLETLNAILDAFLVGLFNREEGSAAVAVNLGDGPPL